MEKEITPIVSPEELAVFKKMRQQIVASAVARILKTTEFQSAMGEKSEEILLSGMTFTAQTLESIMAVSLPDIVHQQLAWGNDYLPRMGISSKMVLRNFEIFAEAMEELIPHDTHPGLAAWMQKVIAKQREFVDNSD